MRLSSVAGVCMLYPLARNWSVTWVGFDALLVLNDPGGAQGPVFKAFRCILPVLVILETYYAWNVIPRNLCPPDSYARILAYLRLGP